MCADAKQTNDETTQGDVIEPGRRNDLTEYAAQETSRCRIEPPQVLRDGYFNTFLPAGLMDNILGPDEVQAIGFDLRD